MGVSPIVDQSLMQLLKASWHAVEAFTVRQVPQVLVRLLIVPPQKSCVWQALGLQFGGVGQVQAERNASQRAAELEHSSPVPASGVSVTIAEEQWPHVLVELVELVLVELVLVELVLVELVLVELVLVELVVPPPEPPVSHGTHWPSTMHCARASGHGVP
jgi:hypothetical protein